MELLDHTIVNHGPGQIEVTHYGVVTLLAPGAEVHTGMRPDSIKAVGSDNVRFEVVPDKGKGKTLEELLEAALRRVVKANRRLGEIPEDLKVTLYEASPTKDQRAYEAWLELNNSLKQASVALQACQINRLPDDFEIEAGRPIG